MRIWAACLAKEPDERPQSASEVWKRLTVEAVAVGHRDHRGDKEGSEADRDASAPSNRQSRSKAPMMVGLFAAIAVLGTAGWWFGVEQPKRQEALAREQAAAQVEALRMANARGGMIVKEGYHPWELNLGAEETAIRKKKPLCCRRS